MDKALPLLWSHAPWRIIKTASIKQECKIKRIPVKLRNKWTFIVTEKYKVADIVVMKTEQGVPLCRWLSCCWLLSSSRDTGH